MGVVQDPMTFVALKEQIHKKCNGYEEFCGNFKKVKKKNLNSRVNLTPIGINARNASVHI